MKTLRVLVLSLALIVRPGKTALRLASLDAPDDLVGGTRSHARRVLNVYLVLTAAGLIGWLLLGGAPVEIVGMSLKFVVGAFSMACEIEMHRWGPYHELRCV